MVDAIHFVLGDDPLEQLRLQDRAKVLLADSRGQLRVPEGSGRG